jgi:hypothetical protein
MGGGGLVEVDGADADGGLVRCALLGREKNMATGLRRAAAAWRSDGVEVDGSLTGWRAWVGREKNNASVRTWAA